MKKLMAANWKMNKSWAESAETAKDLAALVRGNLPEDREVLLIPTFVSIKAVSEAIEGEAGFSSGAQDLYPADSGAFTGEISPDMIKDVGAAYALTGHSERRHVLGETDEQVGQKTSFGLDRGLKIILCVGEKIDERKAGQVEAVCKRQLDAGLADVPKDVDPSSIVIAYEPVWAIGTGEVAGPEDIVAAHKFIREELVRTFGEKGNEIRILYGGSVKPDNATEIIGLDNVDGVLVGGASLRADSFSQIVLA